MREEIYRWLSPPERGTARYRVMTAVKEITGWLLIGLAILLIARACGAFTPAPGGSMGNYLMLALSVVFTARFAVEPVVWLLKKLAGIGRKDSQDI